jgi:hypothetical protein
MEGGCLKSKFKCEVVWCTDKKRNQKAAAIFGVAESNVQLWRKQKAVIASVKCRKRNSLHQRKDDFLELTM